MSDSLVNVRAALATMTDAELVALQTAAETVTTGLALGLLASIAHACDWELHRRRGNEFLLAGPREAIDPKDITVSATTLAVLSASFRKQRRVRILLDAIGEDLRSPPPTLQ
jgi:hypothetical protein